jgi:pyridoxal phosphate enzyme (YggS family)
MLDPAAIHASLTSVRERIARAAGRVHRDPASVRLVAVSKTFSRDHIRAAADAGQRDFGENKVQEALTKISDTASLGLRWHLVGHLQSNKARRAATAFAVIHSVDSRHLVAKLDESAIAADRRVDILVQVDLAGEPTKHGIGPDDLMSVVQAAQGRRGIVLRGLMLLPPATDDPEDARPFFAKLRTLRDDLVARGADRESLTELSMGMSHDFEVAIEEGATIVRVGTAIFGSRPPA